MKVEGMNVDRHKAGELWRKYLSHREHMTPADHEIAAIYKRISKGATVIRALESIRNAGLNAEGLPRLAIARADQQLVYFNMRGGGTQVQFSDIRWFQWRRKIALQGKTIEMDWPGIPHFRGTPQATVPLIPVHLRPKRGLQNYHILWEAEWTKRYPVDPYLLRRFGGDAWLVVAAWDLTDVERAVMSQRVRS